MLKGVAILTEQKKQVLDAAIDKGERYLAAMKEIRSGVSERVVCRKYKIPLMTLRHFIFAKIQYNDTNKVATDIFVKWQEKLFMDVMKCSIMQVPDTAIESMNYAVEYALNRKERDIILKRYAESQTLREIAQDYGVVCETIRQIEAKALKKLRQRKDCKQCLTN